MIPPQEQEKIKNTYLKIAEDLKAPDAVIDHTSQVAETSSGSFGTLSKAIPYVSGIIAQATGNEEDEIAERIISQADLQNYFQFVGGWDCSRCHHENFLMPVIVLFVGGLGFEMEKKYKGKGRTRKAEGYFHIQKVLGTKLKEMKGKK